MKEKIETDVEFLQEIRERVLRCERLTALETQRLLSLAEAGRQQTAIQLLREAQEELRLIRMKDTNAVYDPTLRIRMSLFLDNPAPPSAPVLPEPTKRPQCPRCRSLPPLRMLQQMPTIWFCDCCTQAFDGELKPWSIDDAVLPEGQPQKVCRTCGGTKEKPECVEFGHNGNPHTCMLCVHDFHEPGETSGEGRDAVRCERCGSHVYWSDVKATIVGSAISLACPHCLTVLKRVNIAGTCPCCQYPNCGHKHAARPTETTQEEK